MADKKLDKKTLGIIIVIVIVIAVAILIWLSQRKKAEDVINGEADLINAGTRNYIELRSPAEGNIFITYYDNLIDSSYAGANIYPSYTYPTFDTVVPYFLEMWHDAGRLTQIQYDNAMAQLHDLGY